MIFVLIFDILMISIKYKYIFNNKKNKIYKNGCLFISINVSVKNSAKWAVAFRIANSNQKS